AAGILARLVESHWVPIKAHVLSRWGYPEVRLAAATAVIVVVGPELVRSVRLLATWLIPFASLGAVVLGAALPSAALGALALGVGVGAVRRAAPRPRPRPGPRGPWRSASVSAASSGSRSVRRQECRQPRRFGPRWPLLGADWTTWRLLRKNTSG